MKTSTSKIGLGSDNHSGVHPKILKSLVDENHGHSPAYGTDELTHKCGQLLKETFGPSSLPFFVFNGTAANVLCLKSLVHSYESVICAETSHLNLDECGAPEASIGCKLVTLPSKDGKITPDQIKEKLIRLGDQHYSQVKAVSITQPTELGTVYSMEELKALRELTRDHNLYLHIDGARLIYAAHSLDVDLIDLAENLGVDAISFGGTKNGLLFGEVVLLFHPKAKENFKFLRKQAMQLPSKMRFLASQFLTLLSPPYLWKDIARHGHELALYLAEQLEDIPEIQVTQKVQANSLFVKLPKAWTKVLRENFFFYIWDEKEWVARWMISFDLTKNHIDDIVRHIKEVKNGK